MPEKTSNSRRAAAQTIIDDLLDPETVDELIKRRAAQEHDDIWTNIYRMVEESPHLAPEEKKRQRQILDKQRAKQQQAFAPEKKD